MSKHATQAALAIIAQPYNKDFACIYHELLELLVGPSQVEQDLKDNSVNADTVSAPVARKRTRAQSKPVTQIVTKPITTTKAVDNTSALQTDAETLRKQKAAQRMAQYRAKKKLAKQQA